MPNSDFQKFLDEEGASSPQPQAAPQPQQRQPRGGDPELAQFVRQEAPNLAQVNHDVISGSVGRTPQMALPESPLSPIERGAFSWVDGHKQGEYLEKVFGQGNAKFMKMDDDHSGWVVKAKDGKWRQVDPAGLADVPTDLMGFHFGKAFQDFKQGARPTQAAGDVMRFLDEHGLESAGAAYLAPIGAEMGSVAGPVGTVAGGLIGGAVGALGGKEIQNAAQFMDAGVRNTWAKLKALYDGKPDAAKATDPYAKLITPEDLPGQINSSLMFGATQELAPAALKGELHATAGTFGAVGKRLTDSPEGEKALAGLISTFGGVKKTAAETFAAASDKVSQYIPDAVKDYYQKTDNLYSRMKGAVESTYNSLLQKRGELGSAYDEIEDAAKRVRFNPMEPNAQGDNQIMSGWQRLVEERFIDGKGNIAPDVSGMQRDLTDTDRKALSVAVNGIQKLQKLGTDASYQDIKIFKQNIDKYIWGNSQVNDGALGSILKDVRNGALDSMQSGLERTDPELAQKFTELNQKYGPVKELLEYMGKKVDGNRLDTFLKKVTKADGSYDSGLLSTVKEVLGGEDNTDPILHMDAARQFAPGFVGPVSGHGWRIPTSPRLAAAVGGTASDLQRAFGTMARSANDVVGKPLMAIHDIFKGLPDETRQNVVRSPETLQALTRMYGGSIVGAKQQEQQLLQQSSSFMQSQFGGGDGGGGY